MEGDAVPSTAPPSETEPRVTVELAQASPTEVITRLPMLSATVDTHASSMALDVADISSPPAASINVAAGVPFFFPRLGASSMRRRLRQQLWRCTSGTPPSVGMQYTNGTNGTTSDRQQHERPSAVFDENPELAYYEELVKLCLYRTGVAIHHGAHHLNPFALALLVRKTLNDRETHRILAERRRHSSTASDKDERESSHSLDEIGMRSCDFIRCSSAWCNSTRVGGYEVPWVLQNRVLSLLACALVYDLLFSIATLVLLSWSLAMVINSHTLLCDSGIVTDSSQAWAAAIRNASDVELIASFDSFLDAIFQRDGLCFQLLLVMFSMSVMTLFFFLVIGPGFLDVARCVHIIRLARRYAPTAQRFHVTVGDERKPLINVLFELSESSECAVAGTDKFCPTVFALTCGRPAVSARGVIPYMNIAEERIYRGLADGLEAVVLEIQARGTDDDKYCLDYLIHRATGSSERRFVNGYLDDGRPDGMVLADFLAHPAAVTAGLSPAHVACLRFYTTAGYRSLNQPLRAIASRGGPDPPKTEDEHPFPVTMVFLSEAIKRLRAVDAEEGVQPGDLWRGMRNVKAAGEFFRNGGTEIAPMSTSTDLSVAIRYALGHSDESRRMTSQVLVLKLLTQSFMDRGADLAWCSTFPAESEVLFPPLCYLQPTGRKEVLRINGKHVTVVECLPHLGS